jgi:salicylate hydroxylase
MEQLKIAICGGGIASLCLAHALCKHPQLHVTIYEASLTFRDEGAAVGLGSNAQEALRLISPDLRDALDAAGGTIMDPSARLMMVCSERAHKIRRRTDKPLQGVGPESGHRVGDIRRTIPQIVVHRGPFLRALRSKVPDEALQMGKKLVSIDDHGPRVRLHFEDGTVSEVDALIGCDGINSITRSTVLGADHPATRAVYTGGYLHRVVIPLDDAVSAFGQEYCNDKTQHGWVGDGGFLMTDFVDYGKAMQVIAGWWTKTWKEDVPFMEWPKEQLTADLEPWGDIGKAMTKVRRSLRYWDIPTNSLYEGLHRAACTICGRRTRPPGYSDLQ